MKKLSLFLAMLLACSVLSACTVRTPMGELTVGFDETKKSDQTVVVDENGNETVIETDKVSSLVDKMLDEVALPNGATKEDLKSFVYGTLGAVGIDLDNLDTDELVEEVQDAVDEFVEANGEAGGAVNEETAG